MNQIIIAGQSVTKIEYKNQPVVTFHMIDELHQRPEGTAGRNFRENRERFILNEDYFNVPYKEWNKINELRNSSDHVKNDSNNLTEHSGHKGEMIFLSQSGYLLLTKSLTDDLAWRVQRELVKSYFAAVRFREYTEEEVRKLCEAIKDLEEGIDQICDLASKHKGLDVNEYDNPAQIVYRHMIFAKGTIKSITKNMWWKLKQLN